MSSQVTQAVRRARMLSRSGIIAIVPLTWACSEPARALRESVEPSIEDSAAADTAVEPVAEALVPCGSWGTDAEVGRVVDPELNEISGVAVSRRNEDVLWVHEDHLGEPAVYAIDILGNPLGKVTLDGVVNNDWEDLAVAPCGTDSEASCLYVGEIGDNEGDRPAHAVYRFEEPEVSLAGGLDLHVTADAFPYDFADQNRNVEGMAITSAGSPVLFTKEYEGETSDVFVFPAMEQGKTAIVELIGTLSTGTEGELAKAAATAADFWPDDSRFVLRTYAHLYEFVLSGAGMADVASATRTEIAYSPERQGEAAAYDPVRRGIWHVSEDLNPTLFLVTCAD